MTDQDHQHQPHHSGFMAFLKQLSTFTGDLSQLTAPSFLLNGTSLLEYSAHWLDYPQMLGQMASADSPLERMICAVRWFISTLPGSFYERCAKGLYMIYFVII